MTRPDLVPYPLLLGNYDHVDEASFGCSLTKAWLHDGEYGAARNRELGLRVKISGSDGCVRRAQRIQYFY
jgi:hypothetical protein